MASTTLSFAAARQFMVDSQLRPSKVTHAALLEAMRQVPREIFLPPTLSSLAYADQDVDLGGGRVLMAPLAFARLAQLLAPIAGERVLVVGSGTGYAAAVLATLGVRVVALEDNESLLEIGRSAFRKLDLAVTSMNGSLQDGLSGVQPWDAIFIQGMIREIPSHFATQLRPNAGRLVTVLGQPGLPGGTPTGVAVLAERQGSELAVVRTFDCITATLPGFEAVPEFQF